MRPSLDGASLDGASLDGPSFDRYRGTRVLGRLRDRFGDGLLHHLQDCSRAGRKPRAAGRAPHGRSCVPRVAWECSGRASTARADLHGFVGTGCPTDIAACFASGQAVQTDIAAYFAGFRK